MDNSLQAKTVRAMQQTDSEDQDQVNQTQNLLSSFTFPAILHYLQFQWQKMEHEKQKWLIEKAELQAQQTILEGRIMSQFNLKKDLIRRIKMLEHCLRAERAKYHKLKYGIEPPQLHVEDEELKNECSNENNSMPEITNTANWKKGRHLLRQYLLEIGYTDAIINIRSNRVRLLLGLNANEDELIENNQNLNNINSETQDNLNQQKDDKKYKKLVLQPNSTRLLATEAESTVASTIAFLKEQNNSQINSADQDDNEDEIDNANDIIDSETEEVLSEFDFLSTHLSKLTTNTNTIAPKSKNVDIGELADITPNDENSENVDSKSIESLILDEVGKMTKKTDKVSNNQQDWNPRFLLKSHFDVVRCVRFHYREALVITGSEDETIKLWNLNKASCNTNKNLEPIYTYRGHKSAVLSLLVVENQIYSGGLNGEILVWQIPETFNSIEPYETYDASLFLGNLEGHTDAVWNLVALQTNEKLKEDKKSEEVSETTTEEFSKVNFICSASADGTIKIWDIEKKECFKTIVLNETWGKATCLAAFPFDAIVGVDAKSNPEENISQYLAVSFTKGSITIFDINSSNFSQPILIINDNKKGSIKNRINSIIVHPKCPLIVSAHEDKCIRFWNYTTGECDFEMIAHLDEVTCLDFDLKGPHLISGGHDSSVRLWNFYEKRCIKETKSHIEKFSEGVLDVSFHPTQNYFATAGADAKVQIFGLRVNNYVNNTKS